jgi:hypothetical protein
MGARFRFDGPELELEVQAAELRLDPPRVVLQHPNEVGQLRFDPGANLFQVAEVGSGPSLSETRLQGSDALLTHAHSADKAARSNKMIYCVPAWNVLKGDQPVIS